MQAFVVGFNRATASGDTDWLYDHLPEQLSRRMATMSAGPIDDVIVEVRDLIQIPRWARSARRSRRPSRGSVVIDLTSLYSADITFVFGGETRAETGWV